jgi:hypothetical protein
MPNISQNQLTTHSGSSTYTVNSNLYSSGTAIQQIQPKPIFIFGLPNHFSRDHLEHIQTKLVKDLSDYHVMVLQNVKDEYTAKIYSVEGAVEGDLSDVKNYIKSKL